MEKEKEKKKEKIELDQIYNMDCLEGMKMIPGASVDLVVTDPPYRVISGGNKNEKWKSGYASSVLYRNDGKIFDHNDIALEDWMPEVYRVLKEDADFYCMTNTMNMEYTLRVARECGFKLHNILAWEKNTANANRWYMKNAEYTVYFFKGQARTINNPSSKTIHAVPNIVGTKSHPTEKPVELMSLYVGNSSKEGDVVLDPFMGSGTTAVACVMEKRHFIGFELNEEYYKKAVKRVKNEQAQTRLF